MPDAVVVSPATFERAIVPAFQAASATRRRPAQEPPGVGGRRARRPIAAATPIPARALAQTQAIARSIERIAPGQDYLIDNISNTLEVAQGRRAVGKRMFLFLGLPGRPAGRLSRRLRRQHPRQHAAPRAGQPAHPRRASRSPAADARLPDARRLPASARCSGVGLGFLSVMAVLGRDALLRGRRRGPRRVGADRGRGSGCSRPRSRCTSRAVDRCVVRSARSAAEMAAASRARVAAPGGSTSPCWRRPRSPRLVALRAGAFDPPSASVVGGRGGVAAVAPAARAAGRLVRRHRCSRSASSRRSRRGCPCPPRRASARWSAARSAAA